MLTIPARNQSGNRVDLMTVLALIVASALGQVALKTNQIAKRISPSLAANGLAYEWNGDPAQLIEAVAA
jgi:hypothetical protein